MPTNTPPAISGIANQSLDAGSATPALPFTVTDSQTPASSLTVSAASSNPALVPLSNIVLGGSGTNRTVTVTPAAGQTGSATITLTVSDPSLSASTSFVLTVNPLPTVALSSPTDGANYPSPASFTMTASVAANGHTITSVQFYNGTVLLGQTATAPYSFTWSGVTAGTYSLTAQAVFDSGATVLSPPVGVTVQGLPAPWQTVDIGSPGVPGSATIVNDLYTVGGAGNISGSADNFQFLYQGLSGDGEIRCQFSAVQNSGASGCVGVMVRESLTSESRYASIGMTPDGSFRCQRRTITSGSTWGAEPDAATPPNAWVRLVRTENTLYHYESTNPEPDLPGMLDSLVDANSPEAAELRRLLVRRWAEASPSAAAEWASRLPEGAAYRDAVAQVAIAWADNDPSSALAWVTSLPQGESTKAALTSLAYEAARTDPLAALELAGTLPPTAGRDDLLAFAASQWASADPSAATVWAKTLPETPLRENLLAAIAIGSAKLDGAAAAALAANALRPGEAQDRAVVAILQCWVQKSPQEASSWLAQFPDMPLRQQAVRALVQVWSAQDSQAAGTWLQSLPDGSLRQAGLAAYAQNTARSVPAADLSAAAAQVGTPLDSKQIEGNGPR